MTDLVRYEDPSAGMDTMQLGEVLAQSGYFQDAKGAAQAIVKVLAGRELGIGPVASMTGIYIVKGRVTLSANVMAAQIKRSGKYNYIVRQMDDKGCAIEFFESGQSIGTSSFDEADARAAGLLAGENWKKFPRNMYFSRAMSNGAKWYCPDVFSGPVYTPDELTAAPTGASYVDTRTGEIIDAPQAAPAHAEPVQQPKPSKREKMLTRIATLTQEADQLDLEITLLKPLDEMSEAELLDHGTRLKAAIDEAKTVQPAGVEEVDLPPITDAERAAVVA